MCDINVFIMKNGVEQKLMENVDVVESKGDEFIISNIFGEEKTIQGKLSYYNNSEKRIVFSAA